MIDRFVEEGVDAMSLSLDGDRKETHDNLRGVESAFERTLAMASHAVKAKLTLQINTAVMKSNLLELPALFQTIAGIGVNIWEVFFDSHRTRHGT